MTAVRTVASQPASRPAGTVRKVHAHCVQIARKELHENRTITTGRTWRDFHLHSEWRKVFEKLSVAQQTCVHMSTAAYGNRSGSVDRHSATNSRQSAAAYCHWQ